MTDLSIPLFSRLPGLNRSPAHKGSAASFAGVFRIVPPSPSLPEALFYMLDDVIRRSRSAPLAEGIQSSTLKREEGAIQSSLITA